MIITSSRENLYKVELNGVAFISVYCCEVIRSQRKKMSVSKEYYSLFILDAEDRVIPYQRNAFRLNHGQQYKVMIYNHNPTRRIDAEIIIDGKKLGLFRVNTKSSIIVERPADDRKARKLTFYDVWSEEGRMANLIDDDKLGKIEVNISIESSALVWATPYSPMREEGEEDEVDGLGGTGLSAASYQKFRTVRLLAVERRKVHLRARMVLNDENDSDRASVMPLA